MNLSPHFTLEEFTTSQQAVRLGIKNEPTTLALNNIRETAAKLEQIRHLLGGKFIVISSGYRSPTLNRAIGGAASSAHCLGFAVDFTCPQFGSPLEVCKAIMASTIKYDQLIYEGTWVHLSFDPKNRSEDLNATFKNGKVSYTKGIR